MDQRVVLLHGFTNEEAVAVLKLLKETLPSAREAAFATTTQTNLEWKVGDLMDHIAEEHGLYKQMNAGKTGG